MDLEQCELVNRMPVGILLCTQDVINQVQVTPVW